MGKEILGETLQEILGGIYTWEGQRCGGTKCTHIFHRYAAEDAPTGGCAPEALALRRRVVLLWTRSQRQNTNALRLHVMWSKRPCSRQLAKLSSFRQPHSAAAGFSTAPHKLGSFKKLCDCNFFLFLPLQHQTTTITTTNLLLVSRICFRRRA